MSDEMATDPELILPPISVADALLSSISPLDRNPTPPPIPAPADPAEELSQLQSIAFNAVLLLWLEGTTTAADEDFRNKCC